MRYLSNSLTNFGEIWHSDALRVIKNIKIRKFKMAYSGHLKNRKNAISPTPFGQF